MRLIKDLQRFIKYGKMSIDSWINLKYIIWFLGNFYFWYCGYSLTDFIIINFMITFINHCAKVHSTAIGVMVGYRQAKELDIIKENEYDMHIDDMDIN